MFYMRKSTHQRNSSYPAMDIRCMPSRSRVYIDIEVEDVCYIETHRTNHGVYAKKRTAHQITVYTAMNS